MTPGGLSLAGHDSLECCRNLLTKGGAAAASATETAAVVAAAEAAAIIPQHTGLVPSLTVITYLSIYLIIIFLLKTKSS